jgi:hypothetical protein
VNVVAVNVVATESLIFGATSLSRVKRSTLSIALAMRRRLMMFDNIIEFYLIHAGQTTPLAMMEHATTGMGIFNVAQARPEAQSIVTTTQTSFKVIMPPLITTVPMPLIEGPLLQIKS